MNFRVRQSQVKSCLGLWPSSDLAQVSVSPLRDGKNSLYLIELL